MRALLSVAFASVACGGTELVVEPPATFSDERVYVREDLEVCLVRERGLDCVESLTFDTDGGVVWTLVSQSEPGAYQLRGSVLTLRTDSGFELMLTVSEDQRQLSYEGRLVFTAQHF